MSVVKVAPRENTSLNQQRDLEDSEQDAEGDEDIDFYDSKLSPVLSTLDRRSDSVASDDLMSNEEVRVSDSPKASPELQHLSPEEDEKWEERGKCAGDLVDRGRETLERSYGRERSDVEEPVSEDDKSESYGDACSKASSNVDSEVEEEWEVESTGKEDADMDLAQNNCIICGQDEEHDPSEEFEEPVICIICGDYCHRQCARDQALFGDDESNNKWRCPPCQRIGLVPDQGESASPVQAPTAHSSTILQPSARNSTLKLNSRPDLNNLEVNNDLVDGSHTLRKRKPLNDAVEDRRPVTRKRRKQSGTELQDDVPYSTSNGIGNYKLLERGETVDHDSRSSRHRRARNLPKSLCYVSQRQYGQLILTMNLASEKLDKIFSCRPKPKSQRRKPPGQSSIPEPVLPHFAPSHPSPYAAPFYSFHDRENDELKSKPYGGILSETDADTSRTVPVFNDREKFEAARQKAEEEWRQKMLTSEQQLEVSPRISQKLSGPPSKIKCINFGGYEIETWYAAPYPEEYSRNRILYICEFCLKYMNSDFVAWRHKLKCPAKHPPGDEIYRDGSVSIFEVDGRKNPVYCQNLCLLAKLFLGSKTLYYDVEPFLFYVMTEYDEWGCHFVGYFSKEKRSSSSNNVSCILTLPIHQRKGYGNLLIDFSYLLTRLEGKTGSPEKPLSDMGLVSYRNYWRLILCYHCRDLKSSSSISELAKKTGMTADDVISGLEGLRALVRDPVTKTYALRLNYESITEYIQNWEKKGYIKLNPAGLVWTPYIMSRSNQTHYDRAPIHTVAPREEHGFGGEGNDIADDGSIQRSAYVPGMSASDSDTANGTATNGFYIDGDQEFTKFEAPSPAFTGLISFGDNRSKKYAGSHVPLAHLSVISSDPAAGIPPSRFEIFPPVQVPIVKRRPGRPFGSRGKKRGGSIAPSPARSSGYNTPRKNIVSTLNASPTARVPLGPRRGRSKLAETARVVEDTLDGPVGTKPGNKTEKTTPTPLEESLRTSYSPNPESSQSAGGPKPKWRDSGDAVNRIDHQALDNIEAELGDHTRVQTVQTKSAAGEVISNVANGTQHPSGAEVTGVSSTYLPPNENDC
ncbi:hypothetical protein FQN57_002471 [Myotisia sp. PD_48]|nr:hypothetical protein FQN57_002471 [Myotisia sp. PD_48]